MLTYLHRATERFRSFRDEKNVIISHGYGASSEDLLFLTDALDPMRKYNWIFPRAPHLLTEDMAGRNACAWFPHTKAHALHQQMLNGEFFSRAPEIDIPEIQESAAQLHELLRTLGIEPSRTILGGFSQGAIMTVEYALRYDDCFAGLLLYSATIIAEKRWNGMTPKARTPYFQTHGTADEVLPYATAERLHAYLQQKGFQGEFFSFNAGHTITDEALRKTRAKIDLWLK